MWSWSKGGGQAITIKAMDAKPCNCSCLPCGFHWQGPWKT